MSHPPDQLTVSGADYFVDAMDRWILGGRHEGNICRMVVDLAATPDLERLRARLRDDRDLRWLAALRMRRPLPAGAPRWVRDHRAEGGVPLTIHEGGGLRQRGDADFAWAPRHDLGSRRPPGLALDWHADGPRGGELVLNWHHTLMDVRGAELLLRRLGRDGEADEGFMVDPAQGVETIWATLRSIGRRFRNCRAFVEFMNATCRAPIACFAPPEAAGRARGMRLRTIRLDAAATARLDGAVARSVSPLWRSLYYLAAVTMAHDHVLRARGAADEPMLIPVPHDMRRKGAGGPICSNQVAFLFFRVEPATRREGMAAVLAELSRQMKRQIELRIPHTNSAMMEIYRPLPMGFFSWLISRPTRGRIASSFFSDVGDNLRGFDTFLGAPVRDVGHLPPIGHPPGVAVVFSRYGGRQQAVLSWVEGCLRAGEAAAFEARLRALLLGELDA